MQQGLACVQRLDLFLLVEKKGSDLEICNLIYLPQLKK